MDLYALMVVRANSCKTAVDRSKFDGIFQKFYAQDSSLKVRITFDILGDKSILPVNVLSILANKFYCSPLFRERLNWQSHVKHLLKEGSFHSMYHMELALFVSW